MPTPPVALLGVPWDAHSSHARGPAAAPALIRAALRDDAGNRFSAAGLDVLDPARLIDAGDVDVASEATAFSAIEAAVGAELAAGRRVLALGGDHAVTWPVFCAHAARPEGPAQRLAQRLAIVHIDAHPDLYDDFEGDPLSHASPFARIMERGLASELVQIGIRASTPHLRDQARRFGVRTYGPDEIEPALADLPEGEVYLSVDLDGLDPAYAPGVNHYEPGGLTVREVLRVVTALRGRLVGADIVEYSPARDHQDMTAKVAAKLAKEIICAMGARAGDR